MKIREAGKTVGRMEYRAKVQTEKNASPATNSLNQIHEMRKLACRDVEVDVVGPDLSRAWDSIYVQNRHHKAESGRSAPGP